MPYVSSPHDGAQLHYVDYRPASAPVPFRPAEHRDANMKAGVTLFFIHGYPMSGQMFEPLMIQLSESHGVRCIATDRRGFGKSEWAGPYPSADITFDTFAQDTLAILKSVHSLGPFVFLAASMGCGESLLVHELMKKDGISGQCKGFVWLSPSLPHPIQSEKNPLMPSRELWDSILDAFRKDRVGFVKASIGGVFGVPEGVEMSETAQEFFIDMFKQASGLALERCPQINLNYDFTEKLQQMKDEKLLILHGDRDQSMPAEASAKVLEKWLPNADVRIYEYGGHGLYYTSLEKVMEDTLQMIKGLW